MVQHQSSFFIRVLCFVLLAVGLQAAIPLWAQTEGAVEIALRDISQRVGRPLTPAMIWRYFSASGYFTSGRVACGEFSPTRIRGDELPGFRVEIDIDFVQYNYVMGESGSPLLLCETLPIPAPNFPTNTLPPSPTLQYTYTPSPTPTPSLTFTPSATFTPTATFTPSTTPRPNAVFCPGENGMATRLAAGEQGRVLPTYTVSLRSEPSSDSGERIRPIYENNEFTVLEGPRCDEDGRAWWRVSYSSSTGWMVEGEGSEYYVMPLLPDIPAPTAAVQLAFATNTPDEAVQAVVIPTLTPLRPSPTVAPTATPIICYGGTVPMPPRLIIGEYGRVTPGEPNNLRDAPASNASLVGQIPGGDVFRVIAGPECDYYGRPWWRVQYEGIEGWTVEGADGSYFVEPVGSAP